MSYAPCRSLFSLLLFTLMAAIPMTTFAETLPFYVGTYTRGESKGIYYAALDLETGKLSEPKLVAETPNPTFLTLSADGKFLYSVGEISEFRGQRTGAVASFAVKDGGKLEALNEQPAGGAGPCHVFLSPEDKFVLVANYGGGSVASLPVKEDGSLDPAVSVIQHSGSSVNPQRQQNPHGHAIYVTPNGKFALAADLGLDQVLVYQWDNETGKLTPNDPPHLSVTAGGGPRHLAMDDDGKFLYVLQELSSKLEVWSFDSDKGTGEEIEIHSTLPDDFDGNNSTAEIYLHPNGKFLYCSNRGHNSIAIFKVDTETGKLTAAGHESTQGKVPRHFIIDPSGKYLLAANQDSHNIVAFKIDEKTGLLKATGSEIAVPSPVCVIFEPK